ncbi:hypothetical protein DM01DRAFT_1338785 [Hesseltinella vesiculosa]|uniref:PHD-type domain-containing protein n=1 Tax=Hesseltinella vesiculosa TaxID=101127 RepID=A0A1X2G9D2_9FUNG|nr:hypothetical protein DM01DRAFT_1338785 [Hesseltinella vesiculosa]
MAPSSYASMENFASLKTEPPSPSVLKVNSMLNPIQPPPLSSTSYHDPQISTEVLPLQKYCSQDPMIPSTAFQQQPQPLQPRPPLSPVSYQDPCSLQPDLAASSPQPTFSTHVLKLGKTQPSPIDNSMSPPPKKRKNAIDQATGKPKRGRPPSSPKKEMSPALSKKVLKKETSPSPSKLLKTKPPVSKKPSASKPKLYCLCKQPYDASRTMIACDQCDQWFHCQCIDMNEQKVDFIDMYFCDPCSDDTGKRTSWKDKCSNPACDKAARRGKLKQLHVSKYCSDHCGLTVARAQLALANRRRLAQHQQEQPLPSLPDNKPDPSLPPFDVCLEQLSKSRLSQYAGMEDRRRLARIREERQRAIDCVKMIDTKQQFLQALVASLDQENRANDHCGFDSRLLWDDDVWFRVGKVETHVQLSLVFLPDDQEPAPPASTICQRPKRCQKHHDWIKVKTNEMDQEREEQILVLSVLARERELIKQRIKRRSSEVDIVHSLMNGTLTHNK